eukprot:jgi/Phyca11/18835/fgenesh1_pg.PHYCAscaffold_41_\
MKFKRDFGNVPTATEGTCCVMSLRNLGKAEKGRRQTSSTKKNSKNEEEEETVKVLFLNDGELDNATASSSEGCSKIVKLLKRLDKMDVMLTDLRSTSIGKAVNKLRKHDNSEIKALSSKLKDKWTSLMGKKDVLERVWVYLFSKDRQERAKQKQSWAS